jgi:hypothetical protein
MFPEISFEICTCANLYMFFWPLKVCARQPKDGEVLTDQSLYQHVVSLVQMDQWYL